MITRDPTALLPETLLVFEVTGEIQDLARALKAIPGLELIGEDLEDDIEGGSDDDPAAVEDDGESFLYLMLPSQAALAEIERLWRQWDQGNSSAFTAPIRNLFDCLKSIRRWSAQDRVSVSDAAALSELAQKTPNAPIAVEIELVFRESAAQALVARKKVEDAIIKVGGAILHESRHPQFSSDALLARLPASEVELIVQRSENSLAGLEPIIAIGPQASISISTNRGETEQHQNPPSLPSGEPIAALFDAVPFLDHSLLKGRLQLDDPANLDVASVGIRAHGTAMASLIVHGDLNDGNATPIRRPLHVRPVMYARYAGDPEEVFPQDRLVVDDFYDAIVRMKQGDATAPASAPTVLIVNVSLGDSRRRFAGRLSRWARAIDELAWRYGILFVISAGNLNLRDLDAVDLPDFADVAAFNAAPQDERETAILAGIASSIRNRSLLAPAEAINGLTVGALNSDTVRIAPKNGMLPYSKVGTLPNPSSAPGLGYGRSIKPDILLPGGQERIHPQPSSSGVKIEPMPFDGPFGLKAALPPSSVGAPTSMVTLVGHTSTAAAIATRTAHRLHDALEDAYGNDFLSLSSRHRALVVKAMLVHRARWNDAASKVETAFGKDLHWQRRRANITRLFGYGVVDEEDVVYCTKSRATGWAVGNLPKESASVVTFPLPSSISGITVPKAVSATVTWFSPTAPGRRTYKSVRLVLGDLAEDDLGKLGIAKEQGQPDVNATKRGTVAHRVFTGDKAAALVAEDGVEFKIQRPKEIGTAIDEDIAFAIAVTVEANADIPVYEEVAIRLSVKPAITVSPNA